MTNVFEDINKFATACDQAPSEANYKMYLDLIREETGELEDAIADNDRIEQLDALVDISSCDNRRHSSRRHEWLKVLGKK